VRPAGPADDLVARFGALFENAFDALVLIAADRRVIYASPSHARMVGYSDEEFVGRDAFQLVHPDDLAVLEQSFKRLLAEPRARVHASVRYFHRDGSTRTMEGIATSLLDEPTVRAVVVNLRDVTDRLAVESALRESEERYRVVSEMMSDFAYAFSVDERGLLRHEWSTPALETISGRSVAEIRQQGWVHLIHEQDLPLLARRMEAMHAGRIDAQVVEFRMLRANGEIAWLRDHQKAVRDPSSGRLVRVVGASRDITEQRRTEELSRRSQRMEALGRLAAGVAHDFNNLLTAVLGYSELVLDALPSADPMNGEVREIQRAAQRATTLAAQLLAFGGKQVVTPKVVELNATVADMERMLRRLIGEDLQLAVELDPEGGCVRVDRGQLEQVLVNLVVNARDAIALEPARDAGRSDAGRIGIATGRRAVRDGGELPAGTYLVLAVSDSGPGIEPDTQARMFEPFFTTKAPGRGTGLGLATAYGIARQSGGAIEVDSAPGRGARFSVLLPEVAGPAQPVSEPALEPSPLGRGDATILVVEDEDAVRKVAQEILERNGYQVIVAPDGRTALELAAKRERRIDLLLTDVVMPGLGGPELVERMRPAKVLFMSGYSEHLQLRPLLQKPFDGHALLAAVRKQLGER
jgi:PAS domain S-box-containing protein